MRRAAAISLLLVSIPKTSFANAGIPLIVVFLPPLWIALPVVIIVETIVVARFLDVPFWRAIAPVTAGNIASTIGGIPLLWIMIVLMQLLLPRLGIPFPAIGWLLPYEEDLWWMVPAALIVFAVPCFLISVAIEAPINRLGLSGMRSKLVWKATIASNAYSYAVLAVLIGAALILDLRMEWAEVIVSPALGWFGEILFKFVRSLPLSG